MEFATQFVSAVLAELTATAIIAAARWLKGRAKRGRAPESAGKHFRRP